ncbi:MAG: hypothetical protein PUD24_01985 [Oscillospiraceae bacterium]|nr:hypothetical protein [Oscillospiraceae bacterium]
MDINFSGYGENALTFYGNGSLKKGMLVKITSNGTVSACASGENFCGVCADVNGDYATVVMSGFVKVPAAKTITPGYQKIAASASDTVTTSTTGREYLVIESDASSVGFIL